MFDTHIHSTFSCDSKMRIEAVVKALRDNTIGGIITEHMDIAYPTNPLAFLFDVPEYFATFGSWRTDKLLLGIEIGMQPVCHEENRQIARGYAFDQIIGSIHVVDNADIYDAAFYEGREKQVSYGAYLNGMLQAIREYDDFDTLGHIDYICRYATYDDPELYYEDDSALWDEIFQTLIEKGKAIEINTRRLDSPSACRALTKLYKRFKTLGGHFATIGSDAHRETEVGRRLSVARDIAEAAGLTPVYFKERQRVLDR